MKLNRWLVAFLALTLALVASLSIVGCGGKKDPKPTVIPEGPETGVYYYDAEGDEYVVSLNNGNKFAMLVEGVTKVGEYAKAEDGSFVFTFTNDAVTTASATISEDVLTLTYNGAEMRFLKKIIYTVNFESNGGSSVESVSVMNGRTVAKPDDPTLAGNVFLGWYTDSTYTTAFAFDSTIITADTTVYAQWASYVEGQAEYTVDLVNGTETVEVKTTIGGKIYGVPTLESAEATFGGWWISAYENGEKLTYQYTDGMVFTANTTLYAVWNVAPTGSKLAAPAARVDASTIKWDKVQGALNYKVVVTNQAGETVLTEDVGALAKQFDFNKLPAGDYVVSVTALASVAENNSEATVRYFRNKALNRVSLFNVIDPSTLVFNAVENATKYLITVDCGNADHNHVDFDNGNSTYFNFANCAMKEGGIVFTVTAVAEGYASTKSEAFVYNRELGEVTGFAFDANTETLTWNAVENAANYAVTVVAGNGTFSTVINAYPSFCLKEYAGIEGGIKVSVTPVTKGYNSPAAAEYVYNKLALATPTNLEVNGTVLSWSAVEGATSYLVKINGKDVSATTNSLDLATVEITWDPAQAYTISVMAVGSYSSLFSDAISAGYCALAGSLNYQGGVLSWTPVIGASAYQVKVNDATINLVGQSSTEITLNQAGTNKLSVRYLAGGWSEWVTIDVYAHTVTFDTRSGSGVDPQYKAVGDPIVLPTETTREGFDFAAWYNTISGPLSNGSEYTDTVFAETGDIVLYAYWVPKTYYITLYVDDTIINVVNETKIAAVYTKNYTLPVPESTDLTRGFFSGWYTLPGGAGTQLTDKEGNCVAPYGWTRDTEAAYAFFETGVLAFELLDSGTYVAKKGEGIDSAKDVVIPNEYKGIEVSGILENGFAYSYELETISFPNTFTLVGTGAFNGCSKLTAINVIEDPDAVDPIFWSEDGVLMRRDSGANYLELVPRGKTGEYTIPETVDNIRGRAFYYSNLSKVTIPSNVTFIAQSAFYTCRELTSVVFEYVPEVEEGEEAPIVKPLTIEAGAFYNCPLVESIYIPARLTNIPGGMLDAFSGLKVIDVEEGNPTYSSVSNMLCNAAGNEILYCPKTISGVLEIPVGITKVGANVFQGRSAITEIIIPAYVVEIGNNAFYGCSEATKVTFKGNRSKALKIGNGAFANSGLEQVIFEGNDRGELDAGAVTIGSNAFGNNKITTLTFKAGANIAEIGMGAFAGAGITTIGWEDGSSIAVIGARAFSDCTSLTEVVIPATTVSVGDSAFEGCTSVRKMSFAPNGEEVEFGTYVFGGCVLLREIYLPANVTTFDGSVFDGCDSITEIKVADDNPSLTAIEGILYDKQVTEIMYYPKGKDGDLSKLPDTLTKIGGSVFQNNPKITTVTLSDKIDTIGARAFNNCINLTSVEFKGNVASFYLGDYAFANCAALEEITIPANTTYIGKYAFYKTPLTAFTVPNKVTTLGEYAFAYTYIETINVPASVTKIGNGTFSYCENLEEIVFDQAEGAALTIGGDAKIAGPYDISDKEQWELYHDYKGAQGTFAHSPKLTAVDFPARLTTLGSYSFYKAETLTNVTFGTDSKLVSVEMFAFYGTNLSSFGNVNKLASVGEYAFYGNTGITQLNLPNTLQVIGGNAFNSTGVTTVTIAGGAVEGEENPRTLTIQKAAFSNTPVVTVNLPARLMDLGGKISEGSGSYAINIPGVTTVFENVTTLTDINVEEGGANYSSVDGVLYNANQTTLIYAPMAKTGEYTVPNTVTLVESRAFYQTNLTKVTFEDFDEQDPNYGTPILQIGSFNSNSSGNFKYPVFGATTTLTEVNLPSHLKAIHSFAFAGADALTTLTFHEDTAAIEIKMAAFEKARAITEIHLPAVKELGTSAFLNASSATEITFGEGTSIKKIDRAFGSCSSLETFVLPASVEVITSGSFSGCTSLTSWTVEEGSVLHTFENSVFGSCDSLTTFKIPDTVTKIGYDMFNYCSSLESIELPVALTKIPAGSLSQSPFGRYDMPNFTTIIVPEGNTFFEAVDGVLYDEALTTVMVFPSGKDISTWEMPETVRNINSGAMVGIDLEVLTLPEGIQTIGASAFQAADIKVINLPASLETIADYAFFSVPATELNFAENSKLTTIGQMAFYASKIEELILPDTVTTIGVQAFMSMMNLKKVQLPQNAAFKVIPNYLFQGTTNLETVIIPSNVTTISQQAFWRSGIKNLTIPASVTEIQKQAFYESKIENLVIEAGSKLTTIGEHAFNGSSLKAIDIPNSLTSLGKEVFINCANLEYVKLSDSLAEIPANTFQGCVALSEVVLPKNLNKIGVSAFAGTALTEVTIPATVTEIGNFAFDGCAQLAKVTFEAGSQLTKLGNANEESAIFRGTTSLTEIKIPSTIEELGGYVFANSGLTTFVLNPSMKTISDYAFAGCVNITEIVIPDYITEIGEGAFDGCINVTKVEIPLGVETIGSYAFANCTALTTANVPASVVSMGQNPFSACPNLAALDVAEETDSFYVAENGVVYDKDVYTLIYYPAGLVGEVVIPETVRVFAGGAFAGSSITSITIPDTIQEISANAFKDCLSLTEVIISKSVTTIADYAFENCDALETITIPNTVATIGQRAFYGCDTLSNVIFEKRNSALTLGDGIFENCLAIKSINLPNVVTKLPAYAFAGSGLEELVIPAGITDVSATGIFKGCPYLKTVTFHENVTGEVGNEIFMDCAALEYVDFTAATDLYFEPLRGFMNTPSLVTVYFADGMSGMMAESCFENSGLQYLDFSMVEFYGSWSRAFANCTKLHTIVMCDTFYDIEWQTFLNCSALDGIIHVPYCWLYGEVFNGCTEIDELHFSSGYDAFDYANFVGWTSDQKIVLYGWTAADNEDYDSSWDDDCEAEIVEM